MSSCCLLLAACGAAACEATGMPVTQGTLGPPNLLVLHAGLACWCLLLKLLATRALHGSLNPRQHRAVTFLYTAIGPIQRPLCPLLQAELRGAQVLSFALTLFAGLSTMHATCGIVQSLCCPAWTNSGTNTSTWRRCWAMCLQRVRSLSAGCSGSQTTTVGQPMSRSPPALCLGVTCPYPSGPPVETTEAWCRSGRTYLFQHLTLLHRCAHCRCPWCHCSLNLIAGCTDASSWQALPADEA